MFLTLLCCLAALCQGVLGEDKLHIKNASDLIGLSKNVSSGTSYKGTTVFLDADIDFSGDGLSEKFEPIGKDWYYYFQGTFDGQGHIVSNLAMNSSSQYAGLFGHSREATIKNVVLDSSCSIVNSLSGSIDASVSGVIGRCFSGSCTIENNVNMASVAFTGNITGDTGFLFFGGIVGWLSTLQTKTLL